MSDDQGQELVRVTSRFSPDDILILDRLKDAGCYTSRNAALIALIRRCAPKLTELLDNAFDVTLTPDRHQVDDIRHQADTTLVSGRHQYLDTNLTPDRHQGDTNIPDWTSLIENA